MSTILGLDWYYKRKLKNTIELKNHNSRTNFNQKGFENELENRFMLL